MIPLLLSCILGMGGLKELQQSLDHVIALLPVLQLEGCWINLQPSACF